MEDGFPRFRILQISSCFAQICTHLYHEMHRLKNMFVFLCAECEQFLYEYSTQKYKRVLLPVCDGRDECKSDKKILVIAKCGNVGKFNYCNYRVMCYNIISKGNRHRVVDLWYERRPSLSRSKYREGLYYFNDKSSK